jgi:hypothetical protein
MNRYARTRAHAIRPIRRDLSNPSILFQRVPAGTAGRRGPGSNAVVQSWALDPITAGTPDRHGDQELHSGNARVAQKRETALAATGGNRVAQQHTPLLAGRGFSLKCRAA